MAGKRTVCLTLGGWCRSSRVSLAFGSSAWAQRLYCAAGELGMAEIGLLDSARDDEVVVAELHSAADPPGQDPPAFDVEVVHLG